MTLRTNNIRAFYVVQFMELPFEGVDDYVCVPYSWLVIRRAGDDRAMVAYPKDEDPFDTRDRAKRNESCNDEWILYQANVKYESDTYRDAEFWIATRNDYGPIIENESNISAISQYVPPPLVTPSASRTQPSPEPVAIATPGTSRQRRRQLVPPLGPARCLPTRATSPLPSVPTTSPPSNTRQHLRAASPHSSVATPNRRHLRARRTLTPFDRATSEFVAIEQRRLQLEERRAETEARRVEVDSERNNLLSRFANIAEAFLQQYLDRARGSDSTVRLDSE